MARSEKQKTIEDKYKSKMETWKEAYKERTSFASKFKLEAKKTKSNIPGTVVDISNTSKEESSGSAEKASDVNKGTKASGGSETGRAVAEEATKFIKKCVYRWGGKDPTSGGADCSGFTSYIYKKIAKIDIGGSTSVQNNAGTKISKSEALPGDLIMFQGTYRAGVSHVGIVYDWPKIIHCAGEEGKDGVQWGEMETGGYWDKHFLSIRRVIKDNGEGSAASSGETKAKSFFIKDTEEESTTEYVYKDDSDGAEWFALNGKTPTSTPDAPAGYYDVPLHWLDGGAAYKSISINGSAGHIQPPKQNRALFLYQRIAWARETNFNYFEKINEERFVHLSRHDGFEGNLYSPDAKKAFEIFLLKSKREKLEILSGFRFSPDGLLSPHEAGCAIDIRVYGYEDARKLADTAWICGFRAIAIGGDIENNTGFLHIDIGPASQWGYDDIPPYYGPGRWY